jgi:septal ring factor EnvC (AmiA/AmiB activator)
MTTASEKTLVGRVNSLLGITIFRIGVAALLSVIALLGLLIKNDGEQMLSSFIATNPVVLQAADNAKQAKDAVLEAKRAAEDASHKTDQIIATQQRLFDSLKDLHDRQINVLTSLSALTDHVAGVEKQVDRLTANQDQLPVKQR